MSVQLGMPQPREEAAPAMPGVPARRPADAPAGLADLVKLGMQPHKGFLDDVLGDAAFAGQAQGIAQEGRFQDLEENLYRLQPCRRRAGLV